MRLLSVFVETFRDYNNVVKEWQQLTVIYKKYNNLTNMLYWIPGNQYISYNINIIWKFLMRVGKRKTIAKIIDSGKKNGFDIWWEAIEKKKYWENWQTSEIHQGTRRQTDWKMLNKLIEKDACKTMKRRRVNQAGKFGQNIRSGVWHNIRIGQNGKIV